MKFPIEVDFKRITGVSFGAVRDDFLTVILNRPVMDPSLFDKYLHGRFGKYEERGLSMQDVLDQNFAPEEIHLFEVLLLLQD